MVSIGYQALKEFLMTLKSSCHAGCYERGSTPCRDSMLCRLPVTIALVLTLWLPTLSASAGEPVYKPVNPNFGGNPFNDGILLGTANAQNKFTAKREEQNPTE